MDLTEHIFLKEKIDLKFLYILILLHPLSELARETHMRLHYWQGYYMVFRS